MKGVQGNFAAQVRVFGHDAVAISADANPIANTEDRGVCLFVGTGGNVTVKMESGSEVTFYNVPDGHFLPILVTHVTAVSSGAANILAIY
tara:strand:- start:1150 stop:1419 length:270 start_codon:yes stop_codon:yes gene_type:complete